MSVAIPEKTLEHWASQYITYRFRSKASLWWPAYGQDIDVGKYPKNRIGKAVQIEVKTCSYRSTSKTEYQEVFIDLGQLCDYLRRPHYEQPFYAIPNPDWPGSLEAFTAARRGPNITEQAFRRSGEDDWWFASWMRVLTTQDVASVLAPELHAHRAAASTLKHGEYTRGVRKRLVQYEVGPRKRIKTSWSNSATPRSYKWRDFWNDLKACGSASWPQTIWLPPSLASGLSHQELARLISSGSLGQEVAGSNSIDPFGIDADGILVPVQVEATPSLDPDNDDRFGAWLAL